MRFRHSFPSRSSFLTAISTSPNMSLLAAWHGGILYLFSVGVVSAADLCKCLRRGHTLRAQAGPYLPLSYVHYKRCAYYSRKTSGGDCRPTFFLLSSLPFSDSGTAEPFFLIISAEGRPFGQATRPPQCDLRPFLRCCLLPSRDRPCFSGQGVPWKYKRLECPLSLLVPLR